MKKSSASIWGMALGYFLFYIPYSALLKAISSGWLPGSEGAYSGFQLLPAVLLGTFVSFQLILILTGWWKHADQVRLGPVRVPFTRHPYIFYSGIATATIIVSTMLAYTFHGISIVFTLLLMRGGVLILAPMVDKMYHRRVHWYSWAALAMSFLALGIALADQNGYVLSWVAIVDICAYLTGYLFRLQFMTRFAKTSDRQLTRRYFAEEMIVASVALLFAPFILALGGSNEMAQMLQEGIMGMFDAPVVVPQLLVGALYAGLYVFGTSIYLDHRENTYCIPINRCSSLLSGVVASFLLTLMLGKSMVNPTQLLSAGIILVALLLLSYPSLALWWRIGRRPLRQLYIFVCSGNTSRSPIAQAICTAELAAALGAQYALEAKLQVRVMSAGLSVDPGAPLHPFAEQVLREMNVPPPAHRATNLTAAQVKSATLIWCMSEEQQAAILEKFPFAEGKIKVLSRTGAIENPAGKPIEVMRNVAFQIRDSIQQMLRNETHQLGFERKYM